MNKEFKKLSRAINKKCECGLMFTADYPEQIWCDRICAEYFLKKGVSKLKVKERAERKKELKKTGRIIL